MSSARPSPATSHAYIPSGIAFLRWLEPWSVAIQSRPLGSKAQLSGEEIQAWVSGWYSPPSLPSSGRRRAAASPSRTPSRRVGFLALAARRDQLEHLTVLVLGPRVGSVHLVGLALGVVGEVDVDATVHRVRLDVLGPVHGRRADLIGGEAGPDQHVRLAGKAVLRGQRTLAMDQRQPGELVLVELGDIENAVVQQRAVGGAGGRVIGSLETYL